MRPLLAVAAVALLVAPACDAKPKPSPTLVFVMAGQSNMSGRGQPIPAEKPDPRLLTLNARGRLVAAVDPLGDQGDPASPDAGVGAAVTFGKSVVAHGFRVILVMCAKGSTSMRDWQPGQPLYQSCLSRAQKAHRYGRFGGLIVMQGESDALNDPDTKAWPARFTAFVDGMRSTLGDVPVVYGQIGEIRIDWFPWRDEVQDLQASVQLPCTSMVAARDLPVGPDQIHFSVVGAQELGRRLGAAWLASGCHPKR